MKATTIKVEGELLEELNRAKPRSQSLSAYVRGILSREINRKKMAEAADRYAHLVRSNPEEAAWLAEWESADLARPPKRRRS